MGPVAARVGHGARALLRGSSRRIVGVVRFEGRAFFDFISGVVVLGAADHSERENERTGTGLRPLLVWYECQSFITTGLLTPGAGRAASRPDGAISKRYNTFTKTEGLRLVSRLASHTSWAPQTATVEGR